MTDLLAFTVLWLICGLAIVMAINTMRASLGSDLNDPATAFCEAFLFGPISVLMAFAPRKRAAGKSRPSLLGGIVGCVVAYNLYQII